MTPKEAERLLSTGADAEHPDLQPVIEDALGKLRPALEERGVAASLDLSDRAMLARFLVARKFQIDATVEMLAAHVDWVKRTLPVQMTPALQEELAKEKGFVSGTNALGQPLVVVRSCRFDPRTRHLPTAILSVVLMAEQAVAAMPEGQTKFALLYDRTNFSLIKHFDFEFLKGMVKEFSNNYPERLAAAYVFPAGAAAVNIFNMLKVFLDPRTAAKVKMVESRERLATLIPEEVLSTVLDHGR